MRLYATMKALFYAPFYAALTRGHFEKEGVTIDFATAPHPDDAVPALLENRVDVTWGGPIDLMLHRDQSHPEPLLGFCEVVARDPFLLVGRQPLKSRFSFHDLIGTRFQPVAEVETPWLCLQEDIRRAGIDPSPFNPQKGRTMSLNAEALRKGELDVIQVFEPFAEELVSSGKGHVWYAGATRGPNTYTTLFAKKRTISEKRKEIVAMVRGMRGALDWIHASSGTEIAGAIRTFFPDIASERLAGALDRYKSLSIWSHDPHHTKSGFVRLKSAVLAGGWISDDVPFSDCIDLSIADEACR